MKDIGTYEDCLLMVEKFYDKLLIDPEISRYFVHLNLTVHIPRVADFWAFILVDKSGYSGNMMAAHAKLPLKESDFKQWLNLFQETVQENFKGEKAQLALERSKLIAWTMTSKIGK